MTVIAAQTGLDAEAAFRTATEWFNDGLARYVVRDAAVVARGDDTVAPFLAARRAWLRATYDWSLRAARYA